MMRTMATILFALAFVFTLVAPAAAQIPTMRLQGPRTLVGIVVDTAGAPIAGVEVSLPKLGWSTRSRANGTFRFDSIPDPSVEVRARGVGMVTPAVSIAIGQGGSSIIIRMARLTQLMPQVVARAARGGVTGVIVDSLFRPIGGVKVVAAGAGSPTTVTDSAGVFFMPLRQGRYMLRMDRDGFDRQTMSVAIDDSLGQKITAMMSSRNGSPDNIEAASLAELDSRMIRVSPVSSKFMTHDDLEKQGVTDLLALQRRWGTGRITPDCMVTLGETMGMNGAAATKVPIAQLMTADLEFVEVYLPTAESARGPTSVSGATSTIKATTFTQPAPSKDCGNISFIVWLRK